MEKRGRGAQKDKKEEVMDKQINRCVRCGKESEEKMTVIPKGFKNAGKYICNSCAEEIWDFIMNSPLSDDDKESE
jgi:protein-arginine kinase activator protein McsA